MRHARLPHGDACVCCGSMKIALHGKFKTHIPRQPWARYREKHRESSKGREYEKRGMLTETQRGKRQTVDSRGLRRGRKREGGEWFRDKDEGEGEREEYKKHTGAGRARDPSLRIRRRVKRRETPEERRPRAGAQEGEKNTGFKEDNDLCLR